MGSRPIRSLLFRPEPGRRDESLHEHGPAWSSPYYFNACQTALEVADPLEGAGFFGLTNLPDSKYLVADGAFLSWFARQSPSTGVGGSYDLGSVFSAYSTAC
jgi:hypothetical protein